MKPYEHQQKIIDLNPKRWLFSWEMGTGKSYGVMFCAKHKALVVVPKLVYEQWLVYAEKFNIDVIDKEDFKKHHKELKHYDTFIIDEAHHFSGMTNGIKRSGMLNAALWYVKKHNPDQVFLLTGTPYRSKPYNVLALAWILGVDWKFKDFKEMFFINIDVGEKFCRPMLRKKINWFNEIITPQDAIARLVNSLGNSVKMSECKEVPEQTYLTEYVDLTSEQKRAIKVVKAEIIDDTEKGALESAISRWTKIHQICSGTLNGNGYEPSQFFKCRKTDRVLDLSLSYKKFIVVCKYKNEILAIKEALEKKKYKVLVISGGVKNRAGVIAEAEASENCILLINCACSEGYQLPSFSKMIFYNTPSLCDYLQIRARILRIDKLHKNVYIFLLSRGTIDEDVKKCLDNNEEFSIEIYAKNKI